MLKRRPSLVRMQSFSPQDAVLLALQGYDEYYENRPLVGFYNLAAAAGGGMVFGFHDDDHHLRDAVRKGAPGSFRLALQGKLPVAVCCARTSSL